MFHFQAAHLERESYNGEEDSEKILKDKFLINPNFS